MVDDHGKREFVALQQPSLVKGKSDGEDKVAENEQSCRAYVEPLDRTLRCITRVAVVRQRNLHRRQNVFFFLAVNRLELVHVFVAVVVRYRRLYSSVSNRRHFPVLLVLDRLSLSPHSRPEPKLKARKNVRVISNFFVQRSFLNSIMLTSFRCCTKLSAIYLQSKEVSPRRKIFAKEQKNNGFVYTFFELIKRLRR